MYVSFGLCPWANLLPTQSIKFKFKRKGGVAQHRQSLLNEPRQHFHCPDNEIDTASRSVYPTQVTSRAVDDNDA